MSKKGGGVQTDKGTLQPYIVDNKFTIREKRQDEKDMLEAI